MKFLTLSIATLSMIAAGAVSLRASEEGDRTGAGETSLENVRTAYGDGKDREAVLLADRALAEGASAKTSGELHFWRGSALRRLGRHEEAIVALESAERLGFRPPEVHLERALARRALGQDQEASREFQEAERLVPEDLDRRALLAERWKREGKKERPVRVSATPQMGYDSNIVGLDKDAPTSDPDLERDSVFAGAILSARVFVIQDERQTLALEFRNQLRTYLEETELSYTDHTLSATGRQPVGVSTDFEVRAALGESFMDGEGHLRTTRSLGPSLLYHPAPDWLIRLWADWTNVDYYDTQRLDEQDRDGDLRRVGLAVGIDLGGGWGVLPSVSLLDYAAEGSDHDYDGGSVGVTLTTGRYLGCVLSTGVNYTLADYSEPNSVVNFTKKRKDRILGVSATLTFRSLEEFLGYAPAFVVSFLDHRSNIDAYDYERWEPRIEVTLVEFPF